MEERTVEPIRSLERQVIQDWAEQQERKQSEAVLDTIGVETKLERKGKKTLLDHDVWRDNRSGTDF